MCMKAVKKPIDSLTKCYAVAPVSFNGRDYLAVAAEKQDACNLYGLDGHKESTVWDGPGGTMSLVQVPGIGGFFATQRFYSPNDSEEAAIVYVTAAQKTSAQEANAGSKAWNIRTLLHLPFLHRFDIIERGGVRYLFMCTIKSHHRHKDDWSSPGRVYAGILPDTFETEDTGGHSFGIRVIKDGLTKNHGYTRDEHNGVQTAIVCAEEGVFRFTPPERPGAEWGIEQLLNTPASDTIAADLNGDGKKELLVISPFHGDDVSIYEEAGGSYKKVYAYPEPAEFSHAIEMACIAGKEYVFIGHRGGKKRLLAFYYDEKKKGYTADILDEDAGAANACFFRKDGACFLAATNREINEVALYGLTID